MSGDTESAPLLEAARRCTEPIYKLAKVNEGRAVWRYIRTHVQTGLCACRQADAKEFKSKGFQVAQDHHLTWIHNAISTYRWCHGEEERTDRARTGQHGRSRSCQETHGQRAQRKRPMCCSCPLGESQGYEARQIMSQQRIEPAPPPVAKERSADSCTGRKQRVSEPG